MVMLKVESIEASLSLLKQAALLSLLLERGGEIACFKHRDLTPEERENYDLAAMLEFCKFKGQ